MVKYPEWNQIYFPTLLRCEQTHFWGYVMSPAGRILALASPDPIASYTLDYKQYEHRVFTFCRDLLHCGPLPASP